jgi:hypothetical protein
MSEQNQNIKDIIKQEYIKCMTDPAHFMKKYCMIQHPTRGRIPFNLYPFQDGVLHQFQKNNYSIVLKSRQLGISTLVAGFSLWMMIFHRDKNILCIATKQETAKNMVTKVRFMYDNLPSWLKGTEKPLENNKLLLKLPNGSQVKATSAAGDAGRSEAVSLLIIDEAAFIDNIHEIFASAQQTLATGGGCIALSTPNGTGNWFHQTWSKSELGANSFVPIKLKWNVHPERDQGWRDLQDQDLGIRMAAQECDCDFSTSGDTVFEPELIDWIEANLMEPIEKRNVDGNLWIWEQPDYNRSYLVTADVARGDGKDYSACHVFDLETATQVAEYRGQIGTRDFGHLLVGLAAEYNDALLAIENANVGWDTVQTAIDRGYKNLYYSPKTEAYTSDQWARRNENQDSLVAGFTTSVKTRPLMIEKFREYTKEKACFIRSKRTLEEMKVFIWKNSKAQAQEGYNDDLVMSFSMGLYLRDTALRFRKSNIEFDRAAVGAISVDKGIMNPYNARGYNNNNPWKIQIEQGGHEDITWLLG